MDLGSGLPVYEYLYLLQFLPRAVNPRGERCLVLGLGAGIVPTWYERQGVVTDVVDIDANVVELARRHFAFQGRGEVHLGDARYYLSTLPRSYDYIVMDTPAVLSGADVNLIQDMADGVLMVMRARKSSTRALRRALDQLTSSKVVGAVLLDT